MCIRDRHTYREVHGRNGFVGKRQKEIGIHAVRGGTVAGEHDVYFFGDDEIFEIKHTANSRKIFVNGALRAARFAVTQKPGMYTMKDIPVSYTHLDVYKRQIIYCIPASDFRVSSHRKCTVVYQLESMVEDAFAVRF